MGKIICEICGMEYDDTEPECPTCGYTHNPMPEPEEAPENGCMQEPEDYPDLSDLPPMPGSLADPEDAAQAVPQVESPEHPMFDYDAVNPRDEEEPPIPQPDPDGYVAYEDLGEDDEDYNGGYPPQPEKKKQPVFLIIFLVILNVAMLAATAFLFFKFLLPGKLSERPQLMETLPPPAETTVSQETTVPTVPCTGLVMTSTGKVELNSKGQYWLIHVKAMPENTTDTILYFTGDENVATVNEEGRVTAVGEGQTEITVTCGLQQMVCPVTVVYKEVEETLESLDAIMPTEEAPAGTEAAEQTQAAAGTEAAGETQAAAGTEASEETQPAETKKPIDPSITLKLKKSDILFKGLGLTAQLELDCDLAPEDVEWSSAYPNIIKVENGKVTTLQHGASEITAKYGDQEAKCIVRCVKSN